MGRAQAPSAWATHWKQSTFYLRGKMTALKDEEIRGTFSLFPSKENRRNLQFKIRCYLLTEVALLMFNLLTHVTNTNLQG